MTTPIHILIVDDEEVIRNLFTDILEDVGYKVTVASRGRQAIKMMKKGLLVDIAFVDCHMPQMSGAETLRAIKKIKPRLPVVMTDSYPDEQLGEALEAGAYACIHKPFNIEEIRKVINRIVKEVK